MTTHRLHPFLCSQMSFRQWSWRMKSQSAKWWQKVLKCWFIAYFLDKLGCSKVWQWLCPRRFALESHSSPTSDMWHDQKASSNRQQEKTSRNLFRSLTKQNFIKLTIPFLFGSSKTFLNKQLCNKQVIFQIWQL